MHTLDLIYHALLFIAYSTKFLAVLLDEHGGY